MASEEKGYSIGELRALWKEYHSGVHNPLSGIPCDACPGDPCYATSFFDWLETREWCKSRIVQGIKPVGS